MENKSLSESLALLNLLDFSLDSASKLNYSQLNNPIPFDGMRAIVSTLKKNIENSIMSEGIRSESIRSESIRSENLEEPQGKFQSPQQVRVKTIPQEARGRVRELVGYADLEEEINKVT